MKIPILLKFPEMIVHTKFSKIILLSANINKSSNFAGFIRIKKAHFDENVTRNFCKNYGNPKFDLVGR